MSTPATPPPEVTFSDRTTPPSPESYAAPEFTPEPVPPLPPVGAASPAPDAAASPETIYRRNDDGSYSAVTVRAEEAPAEMPTWNHYVHTASGKVFQVFDPPAGNRHLDEETGESHQIIGVYPR